MKYIVATVNSKGAHAKGIYEIHTQALQLVSVILSCAYRC